jgi:hypothetical protein
LRWFGVCRDDAPPFLRPADEDGPSVNMQKGATVSVHAEAAVGVLGEADICGSTAGRSMGEMGSVGDSPSRGRRGDCGSPNSLLMVWILYPLPLAPPAHGRDQQES